jgi:hypothetical protein
VIVNVAPDWLKVARRPSLRSRERAAGEPSARVVTASTVPVTALSVAVRSRPVASSSTIVSAPARSVSMSIW